VQWNELLFESARAVALLVDGSIHQIPPVISDQRHMVTGLARKMENLMVPSQVEKTKSTILHRPQIQMTVNKLLICVCVCVGLFYV
jgi:hypothetical protein